jgi:hypothetical protein
MTSLDNGRRSPKKLLRAVVARLLGRKPFASSNRLRGSFLQVEVELSRADRQAVWTPPSQPSKPLRLMILRRPATSGSRFTG